MHPIEIRIQHGRLLREIETLSRACGQLMLVATGAEGELLLEQTRAMLLESRDRIGDVAQEIVK